MCVVSNCKNTHHKRKTKVYLGHFRFLILLSVYNYKLNSYNFTTIFV